MNLSFLPGELYLNKTPDGFYIVTVQGNEVLKTRAEKTALSKYNQLRRELESKFPAREMSAEKKAELLTKHIGDSLLDHNSFRPQEKKKRSGSSRTFG
jgi:hypothetical protein